MVEMSLLAPAARVEPVSDALIDEHGALSVSVEDADAGSDTEQALFGEPGLPAPDAGWQRSTLKALFADEAGATAAAARLLALESIHGVRLQSIRPLEAQDWVRLTQSQFTPTEIAAGFWVVPSWHAAPEGAGRVIRLDPGMAFGTGTHPTTRMCLRWISSHGRTPAWNRVLDYGCGSGILAIGAALHGARAVDAVDIDPAAIEASAANARRNGIAVIRSGLPDTASGVYQLVLANILASPLKLLAPLLCAQLDEGADMVLAGILERQVDELRQAYTPWLELQVDDREEGWVLLTGRLPSRPV